jgi:hypothetical protein
VSAGLGVSIIPAMALEKWRGCHFVQLADARQPYDRRYYLEWEVAQPRTASVPKSP